MNKQELIEELNKTNSICGIEINTQQKQALRYVAIRMEQLDEIDCNQKDQRIAELEKENKTAVKEFAEEVLRTMIEAKNEYRTFLERQRGFYQNFLRGRDWISSNKIYAKIDKLLKERGIE